VGVIAELTARVGAEIGGFKSGMGQVHTDLDKAEGGFGKFGTVAAGAGLLALGAVTGVAAFGIAAVQHATDAGQAAYELSEKFGLLPERASAWIAVGSQLGISGEQIGKGFQFLSKNVTAMQLTLDSGGKISAAQGLVYKELGIHVLDAGGKVKSADELMMESADAFKAMKDGPEKAALAMKLFGKSGTDLLPVLNLGRAGVQDYMDKGKAMGDVMSGPQVEAAHKLYLEQKQLNTAISGVTTQIGSFLMPIMTTVMGFILNTAIPAVQRFGAYFTAHLLPAIQQVWSAFMSILAPALKYISDHFDQIKPVLIGVGVVIGIVIGAAIAIIALLVLAVVGIVAGIVWFAGAVEQNFNVVHGHFNQLLSWGKGVATGIQAAWNGLVGFVSGLGGRIGSAARGMWDGIWNAFRGVLNLIAHAWNSLHFTIGGGSFAGVSIPSVTLGVPQIPSFQGGGTMAYTGLALLHKGETVTPAGQAQIPSVVVNIGTYVGDASTLSRMLAHELRISGAFR
jgi:hypothetical protein